MIKWLNKKLQAEINDLFKPSYGRNLNRKEIEEIALNLVNFFELLTKNENENEQSKAGTVQK